jgi:hypothetical protein
MILSRQKKAADETGDLNGVLGANGGSTAGWRANWDGHCVREQNESWLPLVFLRARPVLKASFSTNFIRVNLFVAADLSGNPGISHHMNLLECLATDEDHLPDQYCKFGSTRTHRTLAVANIRGRTPVFDEARGMEVATRNSMLILEFRLQIRHQSPSCIANELTSAPENRCKS